MPRTFTEERRRKISKALSKGHKWFLQEVYRKYGLEYKVVGEYKNNRDKIELLHSCGFSYFVRPERFLSGTQKCPVCSKYVTKTTESTKIQVQALTNGEYEVIGEYHGHNKPLSMLHVKCGNVWNVLPTNFILKGSRCPKCAIQNILGENHPRWNSSLTDKERISNRDYLDYLKWRKAVYKRDEHTCQLCGSKKSGTLTAHHLNGYDKFIDQRTLVDNGVTLCEPCHIEFHKLYGYGGNTKEQFEEFKTKKLQKAS